MKFNVSALVFWAFLSLVFHLCGGNWLVGLTIGLGISLGIDILCGAFGRKK